MLLPRQQVLLVEGTDDLHVVSHLCEHHNLPEEFRIEDGGGIPRLFESLDIRLSRGSDLQRVGLILDADENVINRWRTVRNILIKAGYNSVPETPDPNGTIIEQEGWPVVGVWLMPDNTVPGTLEDFIGSLVPSDDVLREYAVTCVDQLPERRFLDAHKSKAVVHTWLAWQEKPWLPMGTAIKARYLQAEAPAVQQLIAWLRRLFPPNLEESQPTPP